MGDDENLLEFHSEDGSTGCECTNSHLIVHFKIVKMMTFMWGELDPNVGGHQAVGKIGLRMQHS